MAAIEAGVVPCAVNHAFAAYCSSYNTLRNTFCLIRERVGIVALDFTKLDEEWAARSTTICIQISSRVLFWSEVTS